MNTQRLNSEVFTNLGCPLYGNIKIISSDPVQSQFFNLHIDLTCLDPRYCTTWGNTELLLYHKIQRQHHTQTVKNKITKFNSLKMHFSALTMKPHYYSSYSFYPHLYHILQECRSFSTITICTQIILTRNMKRTWRMQQHSCRWY